MNLLIGFFTVVLILVSLFMVLIILMQRPRADSGLGAALGGGGAADAAFGADTANVLSRGTIVCAVFFFIASFGLYLGHMYVTTHGAVDARPLPEFRALDEEPGATAPVLPGTDAGGAGGAMAPAERAAPADQTVVAPAEPEAQVPGDQQP
jgi:preprotein translocase subunit SecG